MITGNAISTATDISWGTITTAKTLTGEQTQVTETTRNEYNVSLPKNMPQEPFVIKLEVKDAQKTQDKYREALT